MNAGPGPIIQPMRVFLVAAAATAVGAILTVVDRMAANSRSEPEAAPLAVAAPTGEPIFAEAQVFRTRAGMLAVEPTQRLRRDAHPRSMKTYQSLRAFPGAPPRIPHGLTPTEFQTGGCKTCHERGGFTQRFGAYVPLSPHPEMAACLQCHVGDAQLMAIPLPNADPSTRCRQCHAPGATRWKDSTLDWTPPAWPQLARVTEGQGPPPIPHTLALRGNCLSCHSAPAGVDVIRTTHPERANCRQCHVASGEGSP